MRGVIVGKLAKDVEPVSYSGDNGDAAESERTSRYNMTERDRNNQQIRQIDEALASLEEGAYGICLNCEEPIDVARLEVRPMTLLCVECKTAQEEADNRHKRRGYYPHMQSSTA